VAKRTFADWKIRIRSTLAINHYGPETLEEAVQIYINKNVDLYDLPYMSAVCLRKHALTFIYFLIP
jgi:hypothetical protein